MSQLISFIGGTLIGAAFVLWKVGRGYWFPHGACSCAQDK